MSINYKVIEKAQPGVKGGGEKKFYASASAAGEKLTASLIKDIEKKTAICESDIRLVLDTLVESIKTSLFDGMSVHINKFGKFRVVISSNGMNKESEVDEASIRDAKVVFTQNSTLRDMMKHITFKRSEF